MNARDLTALAPLVIVAATAVAVMIATAVRRNHAVAALVTLAGIAAAFASLRVSAELAPVPIGSSEAGALLVIDRYGLFFMGLILAASAAVAVLAHGYLERQAEHREEFYILLLVAVLFAVSLPLVLLVRGHRDSKVEVVAD